MKAVEEMAVVVADVEEAKVGVQVGEAVAVEAEAVMGMEIITIIPTIICT